MLLWPVREGTEPDLWLLLLPDEGLSAGLSPFLGGAAWVEEWLELLEDEALLLEELRLAAELRLADELLTVPPLARLCPEL